MGSKSKRRSQVHMHKPKPAPKNSPKSKATGKKDFYFPPPSPPLEPDEIGIIHDPQNPLRVHSYLAPDGTHIKLNNDTVPEKVPFIEPSLIVTSPDNRGERNTLAYRFGDMIVKAQNYFGPRNTQFLFLGFEFVPQRGARVRYVTDYSAVIQLSFESMTNPMNAYLELAHECVHLLSPDPYRPATILEEGMATVFSLIYLRDEFGFTGRATPMKSYDEAAMLVRMLMTVDPYGIRKMREEHPDTRTITKALILKYYPYTPEEVAARLVRTFLSGVEDRPQVIAQYAMEALVE